MLYGTYTQTSQQYRMLLDILCHSGRMCRSSGETESAWLDHARGYLSVWSTPAG